MAVMQEKHSDELLKKIVAHIELSIWVFNQTSIGFVTTYMFWLCIDQGMSRVYLHVFLVTIGFSLLMSEGIMCHYTVNPLTFGFRRKAKTTIHWVLLTLGGGCGVAGSLIMLIPLNFHFSSTHSKLGFSAFILCLVSMLSGVVSLFSGTMKKLLSPLLNKTFHNLLGVTTFIIALVAQFYGYYYLHTLPASFITLLQVITLTTLVFTSIGPLKTLYQKFMSFYA